MNNDMLILMSEYDYHRERVSESLRPERRRRWLRRRAAAGLGGTTNAENWIN
jgi:hypothetical protein